jgi:hypothetical protein
MKRAFTYTFLPGIMLILIIAFNACKHEPVYPVGQEPGGSTGTGGGNGNGNSCDPNTIYFQNQVLPILVSNCAMSGCHDAGSHQKGIVLDSYASLMNSDIVDPNDAAHSDIYEVITETDPDKIMPRPPVNPLTQEQIAIITQWINQGAQNNVCSSAVCDTFNITFAGSVKPILQNNCQGCHSGSAPSGGIDLSAHAGAQAVALNGKLYGAVSHSAGYTPMPQGGNQLSLCDIRKIKLWIDAGAPNN